MKNKILAFFAAVAMASSVNAAVTLSGTSLVNPVGVSAGDNAVYVIGSSVATQMNATDPLLGSITFLDGPSVTGLAPYSSVQSAFGSTSLGGGANFDQGPFAGQQFSVIVFASSASGAAEAGDTYSWWTDTSWVVPTADGLFSFGTAFDQLSAAAPSGTGSVVPEPSTYAMLAGALALVAVMIRRRK